MAQMTQITKMMQIVWVVQIAQVKQMTKKVPNSMSGTNGASDANDIKFTSKIVTVPWIKKVKVFYYTFASKHNHLQSEIKHNSAEILPKLIAPCEYDLLREKFVRVCGKWYGGKNLGPTVMFCKSSARKEKEYHTF